MPVSLWSPTPPNQQWLVSAMTMHVRTTATGAGHHHGLPNSTRQKDDLEKIKGGGGTSFDTDTRYSHLFLFFL